MLVYRIAVCTNADTNHASRYAFELLCRYSLNQ